MKKAAPVGGGFQRISGHDTFMVTISDLQIKEYFHDIGF